MRELEYDWSFIDAWHAHLVLDALDAAHAEAKRQAQAQSKGGK